MFSAIKQAVFILLCAIVLAALINFIRPDGIAWIRHIAPAPEAITSANATVTTISLKAALKAFETHSAVFIDPRNPENYDHAHIPGALNVPPEQFEVNAEPFMNQIPPDLEVILYCDGPECHLAETSAELMHEAGYETLTLFGDGWQGWQKENLPTASGKEDAS